jgi:hypothetical protein
MAERAAEKRTSEDGLEAFLQLSQPVTNAIRADRSYFESPSARAVSGAGATARRRPSAGGGEPIPQTR